MRFQARLKRIDHTDNNMFKKQSGGLLNSKSPNYTGMGLGYLHNISNLPVSEYTKSEIVDRSKIGVSDAVDTSKLNRLIDVNRLAGNPSYTEPKYKDPLSIVKERTTALFGSKPYTKGEWTVKRGAIVLPILDELRSSGYTKKWTEENNRRSTYNPISHQITGKKYTAEEAHGYRDTQEGSEAIAGIKDWIKNPYISSEGYDKGYNQPGRLEYDTHEVVQPVLQDYIKGRMKYENIPDSIAAKRARVLGLMKKK
jgi:hypothetical protein